MPDPEPLPETAAPSRRRSHRNAVPGTCAQADGLELRSHDVGALPVLKRIFERIPLEPILQEHLPKDDPRTELATVAALMVLFAHLLLAREPVHGVGGWAALFPPELLGLRRKDLPRPHDDRLGRRLDRMFEGIGPTLILAVVRQVIQGFQVGLDELHNDPTTVSFHGAYDEAAQEGAQRARPTHAITWGHSKARRPDLKQPLHVLTVTRDGNVPVSFASDSGNVVADRTHIGTWDPLHELVGGADFLHGADRKLASSENPSHIAVRGGRFVTVPPRGRAEDITFRQRLRAAPSAVTWTPLYALADARGNTVDELSSREDDQVHSEGPRLLGYHRTRKAERGAAGRARSLPRATAALNDLRERLQGPRTRFRERAKVEQAVAEILADAESTSWLLVTIEEREEATFRQATRGRPGERTQYPRPTRSRYTLTWKLDLEALSEAEREDGVFPLLTNDRKLSATEVPRASKRQPPLEERSSRFKTDFAVAPVYLKNISRLQGLLAAYFFALLVRTLLERESRQAMARAGEATLALYPGGRPCARPTTHRLIEVFSSIPRHEVRVGDGERQVMVTKLTKTQRSIVRLLGLDPRTYGLA